VIALRADNDVDGLPRGKEFPCPPPAPHKPATRDADIAAFGLCFFSFSTPQPSDFPRKTFSAAFSRM